MSFLARWHSDSTSVQTEEEYYAVTWSIMKENGTPILLAAGRQGMVRVLDCHKQELLWVSPLYFECFNLVRMTFNSNAAC